MGERHFMKMIRNIVVPVVAIAALGVTAPRAEAVAFDFYTGGGVTTLTPDSTTGLVACGQAADTCATTITFNDVVGTIDVTASALGTGDTVWHDVIPDYGGLGATNDTTDTSTDNIQAGEGVALTFSAPVNFLEVLMLNHCVGTSCVEGAVYSITVDGVLHSSGTLGAAGPLGGVSNPVPVGAVGTVFEFLNIGNNDAQFYISGVADVIESTTSDISEPATLSLFGLGLAAIGAGLRRRRVARK